VIILITKNKVLLVVLFSVFLNGGCSVKGEKADMLTVEVAHPGLNGGKPHSCSLFRISDQEGCPQEYYMDVDSVACGDVVCEVIKVRLHWDALGDYLRYELPNGGTLTKKGNNPFNAADNEKLNLILSDRSSALRNFNPASLAAPNSAGDDVDAVTKPTPLFYQNSVVKGAIYTCYTLWYWVNGDVSRKIFELTSKACTHEHLMRYVQDGSDKFFIFAVEQLGARGIFDEATAAAIMKRANEGSAVYMQAALNYFELALTKNMPDLYFAAVMRFFAEGNSQKRTLCLRSLGEAGQTGSAEFYKKMAGFLPSLGSYFEVHLLLNILEKHDPDSVEIIKQVEKVLQSDNFLIARRAFWFLEKRKLSAAQAKTVEAFRVKYEGRL